MSGYGLHVWSTWYLGRGVFFCVFVDEAQRDQIVYPRYSE